MATPIHDAASHPNPTGKTSSKFRAKLDHLSSDLSRLKTAVTTTLNPNHRHDEKWEQEVDAKMEALRDSHRFRSFSGERDGNIVKWHVDGHGAFSLSFVQENKGREIRDPTMIGTEELTGGIDYFWAFSEIIDSAKESIMILDWWLSPELQVCFHLDRCSSRSMEPSFEDRQLYSLNGDSTDYSRRKRNKVFGYM